MRNKPGKNYNMVKLLYKKYIWNFLNSSLNGSKDVGCFKKCDEWTEGCTDARMEGQGNEPKAIYKLKIYF